MTRSNRAVVALLIVAPATFFFASRPLQAPEHVSSVRSAASPSVQNVALGKPVTVITSDADEDYSGAGFHRPDISQTRGILPTLPTP